jgi:hypothetical protein
MCRLKKVMKKQSGFLLFLSCLLFANVVCAAEPASSRIFPLLGDKVPEEMRDQLPLPFGVSAIYVQINEHLKISDWKLDVNNISISPDLIKLTKLKQKADVESVRFDTWVLPFLNVYGLIGRVEGSASGIKLGILNRSVPTSFKVPYDGTTFGGGAIVAAGYDIFFVNCEVNYTYTEVNRLSSYVKTFMVTPRAGIRVPIKNINMSVYGGAHQETITNRLEGSYTISGVRLDFSLDASASSPWSALAGTQIEFGKHWGLLVEGSFGDRQMGIGSLSYRW